VLYPIAADLHAHRGEFRPAMCRWRARALGIARDHHHPALVLRAGDHVLVTDNVYRSSRNFCNGMLASYGVEVTFFDPLIGAGIEKLFRPNTRAVPVEAPGSQSFEMTDIPAIVAVAHARDAQVIDGNPGRRRA
jgi:cystathionine beta-lyase